jgi:hypothetical protein
VKESPSLANLAVLDQGRKEPVIEDLGPELGKGLGGDALVSKLVALVGKELEHSFVFRAHNLRDEPAHVSGEGR